MSERESPLRLPSARLVWQDGRPFSALHGDRYFDDADPLGERRHVFLDGTEVDRLITAGRPLTVGETGFGCGLTFLALIARRRALGGQAPLVHVSVEGYPMAPDDLARALAPFPELAEDACRLRALWPPPYPGLHRLRFLPDVTLLLAFGRAETMLARIEARCDLWFLDGFSPARNADIWSDPVLDEIARLSRPGTRLATFTSASLVARGLESRGFSVAKRKGHGRKRTHLVAILDRPHAACDARRDKHQPWFARAEPASDDIAVIGTGVAGLMLGDALRAAGRSPVLIAPRSGSGLPAAQLLPRPDLGNGAPARLATLAMRDALRFADSLPPDCHAGPRGSLELLFDAARRRHGERLIETLRWPQSDVAFLAPDEVSTRAGLPIDMPALYWPGAACLDPERLFAHLRRALPVIHASIDSLARKDGRWEMRDKHGRVVHVAKDVVIAAGPVSARLAGGRAPDLLFRRGQIGLLAPIERLRLPLAYDGFLTPPVLTEAGRVSLVGSSFAPASAEDAAAPAIRMDERRALLARLARFGLTPVPVADWAGVRASSPDHLPFAGPLSDPLSLVRHFALAAQDRRHRAMPPPLAHDGLWIFSGLGARGFQYAPLLAAILAAEMTGLPSPVERAMREAVHPARYPMRRLMRGEEAPHMPRSVGDDVSQAGC